MCRDPIVPRGADTHPHYDVQTEDVFVPKLKICFKTSWGNSAVDATDGKDLSKCPDKLVPLWLLQHTPCVCASKEWGLRKSLPPPPSLTICQTSTQRERWCSHWGGKQRRDVTELGSRRADFEELGFYSQQQHCPPLLLLPPPHSTPHHQWNVNNTYFAITTDWIRFRGRVQLHNSYNLLV